MPEEISVSELLFALKKHWKWLLISAVMGAVIAFLLSEFVLTRKYTASLELYVNNTDQATVTGNVNINDINASQKLVNTYIVILKNREVLQRVSDKIGTVSVKELARVITMSSVDQTEVLRISAQTNDPRLSADICNALAAAAPEMLERVVKAGSVEIIGPAIVPTTPSSPNVTLNTAVGGIGLLAAAVVLIALRHFLDNTIKGEDDVRQRTGLPVLGEIPSFKKKN